MAVEGKDNSTTCRQGGGLTVGGGLVLWVLDGRGDLRFHGERARGGQARPVASGAAGHRSRFCGRFLVVRAAGFQYEGRFCRRFQMGLRRVCRQCRGRMLARANAHSPGHVSDRYCLDGGARGPSCQGRDARRAAKAVLVRGENLGPLWQCSESTMSSRVFSSAVL
jgi:hypothetical protein